MASNCVIFGGGGYIGTHLVNYLLNNGFGRVHIADIRPSSFMEREGITSSITDVRLPISTNLANEPPQWIFNLAAVHREPGHKPIECFETNLAGARNVCDYAEAVGCPNIYFTSSISVYGPTTAPADENSPICPVGPYGGSKYPAELIHEMWFKTGSGKRLIICRPGVIYGPGDPGNILRMIRAVKKGYFAFPGSPSILKSYGYIFGLLDSIGFMINNGGGLVRYNYVEYPTEPLGDLVRHIKALMGSHAPVFPIPLAFLMPVAHLIRAIFGNNQPIHPTRVKKAASPTHIVPQVLRDMGFEFKYDFAKSLEHWRRTAPEDFS